MPSTHLSLHYHVVFSTKDRLPIINDRWRHRLHAYMGGAIYKAKGFPQVIGGVTDHVHLLLDLPATRRLADVVCEVKATSSHWVHEEIGLHAFSWQEGYAAFTVSPSHLAKVREYIGQQAEHHRTRTFQEEYVAMLKRNGVAYDEKYLW